ncbi:unnamed protein product [Schistocephalus solidus]|uniref:Secreted protein n=1 Tax=Schistocephalus solidus TaxID=70667 RepID=A0A183SXJ1_SCHSO|nr:unnamed protein product [Schistocephalus solidus]
MMLLMTVRTAFQRWQPNVPQTSTVNPSLYAMAFPAPIARNRGRRKTQNLQPQKSPAALQTRAKALRKVLS